MPTGASAATLLVAQMLTGNVSNAATPAPFGLIVAGQAMEGVEQIESGRSSASGTATIGGYQDTIVGDIGEQEMEVVGTIPPKVPGYEDLRVIYVIVCVPHILY